MAIAVLFISGLADDKKTDSLFSEINESIQSRLFDEQPASISCVEKLKTALLTNTQVDEGSDMESLYRQLLAGNAILLVEGCDQFLYFNTYGPKGRGISEPTTQTIIRGPKEAFSENIEINISLIRKRIRNKSLKITSMTLGRITNTNVSILYLDKIAKSSTVDEIVNRLKKIQVDGLLESSYIEELTKDDPYSIFPTYLNSEKPDSVVAGLLEGKVAIFVDGTPFVLTAPALFVDFFQVSEDYYHHFIVSSFTRILRILAFLLTLLVPATYIALSTFHHEMLPSQLLISIAAQREGVPFPAFVEALLMELTFEILREAGVRMPRAVGSAISIVGALVLGQAAVQAGIISAVVVITVSVTAIASFAIPNYAMSNAVRTLRFLLMILAASFGLYGIYIGLIVLILHLCKIKSFGVPYLTPIAPKVPKENRDTFFRFPLWQMTYRPRSSSRQKWKRIPMRRPVKNKMNEDQEFP